MTCENCDCLAVGDVVEAKMNTNVMGQVLGFKGTIVGIRLSPSLAECWTLHEWEVRRIDDDDEYHSPGGKEDLPEDNVINFTEAVADLATAKAANRRAA